MVRNFLKTAWRNLRQNKGLSFINILGLAMGMAFAMLIALWIQQELGFNSFHKNYDRLAIVMKHTFFNNEKGTQEASPFPLRQELKNSYPEVEKASKVSWNLYHGLVNGDKKMKIYGRHVDPDFLEMFSFPLISGNSKTALNDPYSIILTESTAAALFGKQNPIGKTLEIDSQYPMNVTGVMSDPPANSTLNFGFLMTYDFLVETNQFIKNNQTSWSNNFLINMVELKEGVSMEAFSKKIASLNMQKDSTLKNQYLSLHPMSKWHLRNDYKNWINTGGIIEYVRLFGLIGIFVLLIACINFMNLATARSEKRAREVGVRKAIGSGRSQLVLQFLSEAIVTAFFAFFLAIGIIQLLLPLLKDLGFANIRFDLTNGSLVAGGVGICIITGIIAGSYPAFYLSAFTPIKVLKGMFTQGKGPAVFRKVLVITQFAICVALMISTVIIFQQINHARNRSLGYDPDNLIAINGSQDLANNYVPLKQELLGTGFFEGIAKTSNPMTGVFNSWSDFNWDGKPAGSDISLDAIMAEWDFEKTAGLRFKQGRPFSREFTTDSNAIILNETALRVIGYKDPIGRTMKSGNRTLTIVGIVEDVLLSDPFRPVKPMAILFVGNPIANSNFIYLRLKDKTDLKKALTAMQFIFEKYNPGLPFEYTFIDEEFAKKFTTEKQVGKLAGIFAGLAVFISCLGLFGLAAFMAERRTREIGIRKVLGASVANLWLLLSKEFIWLVMIACVIASPLTYWLMHNWLQRYDYRISISGWVIACAGLLALVVALLTVSVQSIKAAIANPVKSLRTE